MQVTAPLPPAAPIPLDAPASLAPLLDPAIGALIHTAPQTLLQAVAAHGSPLHIVWPHAMHANIRALRAVLAAHRVRAEIFYGAKVNKSKALVAAAVAAGVGVDVSSPHELRDALDAGAGAARLCATGPAKTAAFHAELVACGALICVDSLEEFEDLDAWLRDAGPGACARVLLRYRPVSAAESRFGMAAPALSRCLRRLARAPGRMLFEGFHFHLSGYAFETRVRALQELAPHIEAARARGLAPRLLDIGGGLPIRYVEAGRCEAFLRDQRPGHYRNGKVPSSFYPYGGRLDACAWLERFLRAPCAAGLPVAAWLDAMGLTLAIEPGRSLVDQAAISVFRIVRVKPLAPDKAVLFVEGSSFSACETWFGSEFLVDPIVVPARAAAPAPDACAAEAPFHAYIAGHSCLDDDVLTNRLLRFGRAPGAGDLLVFANTAGYQMDLLENQFHRHPMPRRLTAVPQATGGVTFLLDD